MTSEIDLLNRRIIELETEIDNNAEWDPHYLQDLILAKEKLEKKMNNLILRDF